LTLAVPRRRRRLGGVTISADASIAIRYSEAFTSFQARLYALRFA